MADTYTITSQAPDMELNNAGTGFINGWKVTYKVTSGAANNTVGSVFVSDDDHNAATVKSLIEAKIRDLGEIATLGGM